MFRITSFVIFLMTLSFTAQSYAQPQSEIQFNYELTDSDSTDRDYKLNRTSTKSSSRAYLYTIANTVLPMGLGYAAFANGWKGSGAALMLYGSIIGPSSGNYYARDWTVANTGVGLRTAAIGIFAMSQLTNTNQVNNGPEVILATATATFLATTLYNTLNIPNSIERYNRRARRSRQFNMGPSVDISTGTPVFTASLRF